MEFCVQIKIGFETEFSNSI